MEWDWNVGCGPRQSVSRLASGGGSARGQSGVYVAVTPLITEEHTAAHSPEKWPRRFTDADTRLLTQTLVDTAPANRTRASSPQRPKCRSTGSSGGGGGSSNGGGGGEAVSAWATLDLFQRGNAKEEHALLHHDGGGLAEDKTRVLLPKKKNILMSEKTLTLVHTFARASSHPHSHLLLHCSHALVVSPMLQLPSPPTNFLPAAPAPPPAAAAAAPAAAVLALTRPSSSSSALSSSSNQVHWRANILVCASVPVRRLLPCTRGRTR